MKLFLILVIILSQNILFGQKNVIKIYGIVKDEDSKVKLANTNVIVYKNTIEFQNVNIGDDGKFIFDLQIGSTYDIKFEHNNYVPKIARVETKNVPKNEEHSGYEFEMEVTLFKMCPNFNVEIMKEPVAIAVYISENDEIYWDERYIIKQKEKIDAEFKRIKSLKVENIENKRHVSKNEVGKENKIKNQDVQKFYVTENSYDYGNKKVTERTVGLGEKIIKYKKITSKTGTYYFKNGVSITEQTWRDETNKLMENK